MRIALFSDIHGSFTALTAVLAANRVQGGADILVSAGDQIGGESGADDVMDLLREHDVRMVLGDNDTRAKFLNLEAKALADPGSTRSPAWYYRATLDWLDEHLSTANRDLLESLPLSLTIEAAPGQRLYVCHASPRSIGDRVCSALCDVVAVREAFASVDAEIIAFGHAHEPFVRFLDGRPLVNVASVGMRPDTLSRWTMLTCVKDHWQIVQHCVPFDAAAEWDRRERLGVPYFP